MIHPKRRSATGRPKATRDRFGSNAAASRCAAMSSIHRRTTNGETVLINMKPKTASEWSGNIYSRDSGSTYYATIAMQGPDSLRVEACALGRFFCSGNVWSRIAATPEKLAASRRTLWVPRS